MKTNEQKYLLLQPLSLRGGEARGGETTAPSSLQTLSLPLPGHIPLKTASPPPLQEGKAVPREPVEEEPKEGLIKT